MLENVRLNRAGRFLLLNLLFEGCGPLAHAIGKRLAQLIIRQVFLSQV